MSWPNFATKLGDVTLVLAQSSEKDLGHSERVHIFSSAARAVARV